MTTMAPIRPEKPTSASVHLVGIDEAMIGPIERLLDLTFGHDRHRRTAYALRNGVAADADASCAAIDLSGLVGSLQSWPLALATEDGDTVPLWLMGPIAVLPDRRNAGIARAMIARALVAIERTGLSTVLIGDVEYYGAFGFSAEATGGWRVPGPVERHRLLCRPASGQTLPRHGTLQPRGIAAR